MTKITTTLQPHPAFEVFTPDDVAECWDGVLASLDLYEALWACVASYDEFDREDCGPADVIGLNSVASFWDRFTPEQQAALNQLAERQG